jgi:hypothetical protein
MSKKKDQPGSNPEVFNLAHARKQYSMSNIARSPKPVNCSYAASQREVDVMSNDPKEPVPQQKHMLDIWSYQKEQARQQYKIQSGIPPHLPKVFANGRAVIPSCMPLQHAVNGIQNAASGASRWQHPEGHPPFYTGTSEAGSTIMEYNDLDTSLSIDVWEQVKSFTDLDIDVLQAALVQIFTASDSHDKRSAWVYASQILDYRGITPIMKSDRPGGPKRRAGHRPEDIQDIAQCMRRISNLWVTVHQTIKGEIPERTANGRRRKPKRVEHSVRSRLISIEKIWYQRELLDEPIRPDATPIGWYIRFGDWLEPYLDGASKQIGFICQKSLEYDPYREKWEKRLSRYFCFHIRMNGRHGVISREIGTLLESLTLPIDTRFPERNTRQRFEKALDRLVADRQIDGWEYKDEPIYPSKGWLPTWLKQSIRIYFAPYKSLPSQKGQEERP